MSFFHGSDFPGPVRAMVKKANTRNSFYWDYVRAREMPDAGQSTSRVKNLVPGGVLNPETGTASEEPTWTGVELDCGGDDLLDASFSSSRSIDPSVTFAVVDRAAGSNTYDPITIGDISDGDPSLEIQMNTDDSSSLQYRDSNGNQAGYFLGTNVDFTTPTIMVGVANTSDIPGTSEQTKFYVSKDGSIHTNTGSNGFTGSFDATDLRLFADSGGGQLDGSVYSMGAFFDTEVSDSFVLDRLIPSLRQFI